MYYSPTFLKEQQTSRFDRWRVNYDLLLRIIDAKEANSANTKTQKDYGKKNAESRVR